MADLATAMLNVRIGDLEWPLDELWVTGALLEPGNELDTAAVVIMLGLPAAELPWLAVHPAADWASDQLRLGKRPVEWVLPADGLAGLDVSIPQSGGVLDRASWP